MNYILEQELRRAPGDWNDAVQTLKARETELKDWLATSPVEQFVLVGDQDTEGLAHWAARTFGLISQGVIWGSGEESLLAADSPPTAANSPTLIVFLSRRGGSASSVKVCRKMDEWYTRNRKVALLSSPGLLAAHVDKAIVFGQPELTSTPTLTPTRLMVSLMTLGAIITGKDVLTKRAELLSQWYVPTPAKNLAEMLGSQSLDVHVAAPKRLFSHCQPIKNIVEMTTGRPHEMIDLDQAEEHTPKGLLIGITAKSSEDQDLKNLTKLHSDTSQVIAFSSKVPEQLPYHIALSRRTTDIGRTIHALLNVQKLLLCLAVRTKKAV